jgi:hypothetical protein
MKQEMKVAIEKLFALQKEIGGIEFPIEHAKEALKAFESLTQAVEDYDIYYSKYYDINGREKILINPPIYDQS